MKLWGYAHSYGTSYGSIPWGYRDSWAWKDTSAANVGNWVYGTDNCSDNSTSTQTSGCPFPLATGHVLIKLII